MLQVCHTVPNSSTETADRNANITNVRYLIFVFQLDVITVLGDMDFIHSTNIP